MSALVDGKISDNWFKNVHKKGEYVREDSTYRAVIGKDSAFPAESDRYHLFVSWACPWANRTLVFRQLKQLQDFITVSYVDDFMGKQGWTLSNQEKTKGVPNVDTVAQIYTLDDPNCTTQITVPILWDKKQQCIVNNESSEIIRMFNTAFNSLTGNTDDYYPENLRTKIDKINQPIYNNINNGVYRAGFATSQKVYERAFNRLFKQLDECENILSKQAFLVGEKITEADWRLFVTLIRFDAVYVGHFKCNKQRIADYPNLSNYVRQLYQYPGIKDTINIARTKNHYYLSHESINANKIVPLGPILDFDQAHNRGVITL